MLVGCQPYALAASSPKKWWVTGHRKIEGNQVATPLKRSGSETSINPLRSSFSIVHEARTEYLNIT